MKIVGQKVNDYYDGVRGLAHDESGNIFLREPQEITIFVHTPQEYLKNWQYSKPEINPHLKFLVTNVWLGTMEFFSDEKLKYFFETKRVLVAGKIYGFVHITYHLPSTPTRQIAEKKEVFLYSFVKFKEFCEEHKIVLNKPKEYCWDTRPKNSVNETNFRQHFEVDEKYLSECAQHKLVTAIISAGNRNDYGYPVELNGDLKKIQFFKVMDAFTVYQELAMWVDGSLCYPGNIMVEIEDKYKIEGHGFDKRSFRKDPTKRKLK